MSVPLCMLLTVQVPGCAGPAGHRHAGLLQAVSQAPSLPSTQETGLLYMGWSARSGLCHYKQRQQGKHLH